MKKLIFPLIITLFCTTQAHEYSSLNLNPDERTLIINAAAQGGPTFFTLWQDAQYYVDEQTLLDALVAAYLNHQVTVVQELLDASEMILPLEQDRHVFFTAVFHTINNQEYARRKEAIL